MTSRERFLTAMSNGVPDRVPVTPDISNYIPARRTGLPFWDLYFTGKTDLWRAYVQAAEHFRLDMWIASCMHVPGVYDDEVAGIEELHMVPERDAMVRRTTWRTPYGELSQEDICFRGDPPTHTKRMMKDLESDWPKFRWLQREPIGLDTQLIDEIRGEMESRGQAFGLGVGYPGFQRWEGSLEGSVQSLTYASVDAPAILDEWAEIDLAHGTRLVELFLETRPDYLGLGGSGTLTLASPELARRYALPAIRKWSAMAREAGVPTVLHSCGRSRELVRMLAEETDVSCVNPLEIPPMGDVDLAEVKRAHGNQIALMGNLHTTDIMLRATPERVYEVACDAIRAAGEGGGFILSTGDQCPRETPPANLFALHRAVEDVGVY
jgi:uroporphyrinogen decarboxylase